MSQNSNAQKDKIIGVLKKIGNVLIWVFVVFAVLMTILAFSAQSSNGVPSLGGKALLCVASDSMAPTFVQGDLLIGDMCSDEQKQLCVVGDVISFYTDLDGNGIKEINSHRIYSINYDVNGNVESFVTKGDNNLTNIAVDEEPVSWQAVICKWDGKSRIGGLGAFISFMQEPKGFLVCIVIPLVLFFLFELYRFIVAIISVKGKGAKQISPAEEEAIKQLAIQEYLAQQAAAQNAASDKDSDADKTASGEQADSK